MWTISFCDKYAQLMKRWLDICCPCIVQGFGRSDEELSAWIVDQVTRPNNMCYVLTKTYDVQVMFLFYDIIILSKAHRAHQVLLNHAKQKRKGTIFVSPSSKSLHKPLSLHVGHGAFRSVEPNTPKRQQWILAIPCACPGNHLLDLRSMSWIRCPWTRIFQLLKWTVRCWSLWFINLDRFPWC